MLQLKRSVYVRSMFIVIPSKWKGKQKNVNLKAQILFPQLHEDIRWTPKQMQFLEFECLAFYCSTWEWDFI